VGIRPRGGRSIRDRERGRARRTPVHFTRPVTVPCLALRERRRGGQRPFDGDAARAAHPIRHVRIRSGRHRSTRLGPTSPSLSTLRLASRCATTTPRNGGGSGSISRAIGLLRYRPRQPPVTRSRAQRSSSVGSAIHAVLARRIVACRRCDRAARRGAASPDHFIPGARPRFAGVPSPGPRSWISTSTVSSASSGPDPPPACRPALEEASREPDPRGGINWTRISVALEPVDAVLARKSLGVGSSETHGPSPLQLPSDRIRDARVPPRLRNAESRPATITVAPPSARLLSQGAAPRAGRSPTGVVHRGLMSHQSDAVRSSRRIRSAAGPRLHQTHGSTWAALHGSAYGLRLHGADDATGPLARRIASSHARPVRRRH